MTLLALIAIRLFRIRSLSYAAVFLLAVAWTQLRRWTYGLARYGKYEQALSINRFLCNLPGYGSSLEGVILFAAGRYEEAEVALRPLAFDAQGHPRLSSTDLYVYCLVLTNSGHAPEAQRLLEEAVLFTKPAGPIHVALATCLLTQNKQTGRAKDLMEEVLAIPPNAFPTYQQRADRTLWVARYGWALACCGDRIHAEAALRQVAADSSEFKDRDLAGALYLMGETWLMLGEQEKARTAFQESLTVFPHGGSALSARQALSRIGGGSG